LVWLSSGAGMSLRPSPNRRSVMDTEAVATEIVMIRQRLAEFDTDPEGGTGTDSDDEKKRLHDRMRQLQDQLSGSGTPGAQDSPSEIDTVQYVPPS